MLDLNNVLVKSFQMVGDSYQICSATNIRLCLITTRQKDDRRYNLSTISKVTTLIVSDLSTESFERDTIIEHNKKGLRESLKCIKASWL